MSVQRIASRYAKSLFDLSKADNTLDKAYEDIRFIREVLKNDDFVSFLKNPILKLKIKKGAFDKIFRERVGESTFNTLRVMLEHHRETYLSSFCNAFRSLYYRFKHISSVKLVTAAPLSDELAGNILKEFQDSKLLDESIELTQAVDPELIGGFRLEFDNQVYDASIAKKLDEMKKQFSENLYIKNF